MVNKTLAALGLVAALAGGAHAAGPSGTIRVVDGDTFDIGGTRVRLHGIDAVEADQTCTTEQGQVWPCGAWVTSQVAARWGGALARCDTVDTDRYGRIVARCAVGGTDLGEALVAAGLAFAYRRYSMDYDLTEKQAAVADRGLWSMNVARPAAHRASRATRTEGRIPVRGDCAIKGNISSKGTRIYHVPGQEHYEQTGIREDKGERWFCSEAEARAAGWRRARR